MKTKQVPRSFYVHSNGTKVSTIKFKDMGKIGDSFKREIGKNTGKFVSNLVFGDKHSTPYRRVDGGSSGVRAEAAQARAEAARMQAAALEEKTRADIEKQEKDDLNILDGAVLKNVDIVLQTPIPQNEGGLLNLMSIWAAQLSGSKWDYLSKEGIVRNQFPDALLEKYKQCTMVLKSIAPTQAMIQYYDNVLAEATNRRENARRKKLWRKIWKIAGITLGVLVFIFLFLVATKPF
ncbi:MAG: hypothetical protein K6E93_01690 [Bacteroidales bacterium]|nr:hypothetical protein [Bacteroidales bacterium]